METLTELDDWGNFKAPAERSLRYRVNVSRGMKGSISFEATVDGQGFTMEEILIESDKLVAELKKRYPALESDKPSEA